MRTLFLLAAIFTLGACGNDDIWGSGDGGVSTFDGYAGGDNKVNPGIPRPKCPAAQQVTITGRVTAPNQTDPVPGAVVYIPSRVPEDFPLEVRCEVCKSPGSTANRWWTTTSAYNGSFTLNDVCPGNYWLIMQNGRFRRAVKITVPSGGTMQIKAGNSRLPRKHKEFNQHDSIPKIAVATGDYDKMECVLLKMGLQQSAFDLYEGAKYLKNKALNKTLADLLKNFNLLKSYNIVFINCADNTYESQLKNSLVMQNLQNYIKQGGRLYITDWSYDWMEQLPELSPYIDFEPGASGSGPEAQNTAALGKDGITVQADIIDPNLAKWLGLFGGAIQNGKSVISHFLIGWVIIHSVSKDVKTWVRGVIRSSTGAIQGDRPLTVTFNYKNCGKALFSSYHTEGRDDETPTNVKPFPSYCSGQISPQDRILEYLIFDIANCVTPIK